jgi:hypothetical protein
MIGFGMCYCNNTMYFACLIVQYRKGDLLCVCRSL